MSLSRFFRRKQWDAERAKELESYLQIETDANLESGMSPADARAAARRKLGNLTSIRETIYEMNSIAFFDNLWRDLRFAFRTLRKRPGFTLIVVLSLALGIGANTAIFSIVDAILLRPLAVPNAGGIIAIDTAASRLTRFGNSSYLDYMDFHSRAKSFKDLAIYQQMSAGMSRVDGATDRKPEIVYGLLVSGNFFSTFEVQPSVGRVFLPEEGDAPNKYPVAVISHALWNRAFGADPNVAGKIIKLSGHSFTIVGVAPKTFTGADLFFRPDIYVPAVMSAQVMADGSDLLTQRTYRSFEVRGRLNPGISVAQAQAEMNVIMSDLEREHADTNKDTVAIVRKELSRRIEGQPLTLPAILAGLVVLVLLMACTNVASLLMAKATSRLREISTQISLGATRGNLVRQFLTESAVLAALGGAAGILVAHGCMRGFAALVPTFAGPGGPEFRLDVRVLSYALAASIAAVFLFGLAPALTTVKEAWSSTLTTRSAVSASRSVGVVARRILIGGQVALSVVLLIAGGLFLKSFGHAQRTGVGFNPDHLLLATIDPMLRGYSNEQAMQFNQQLLDRMSNLHGVKSAALGVHAPFLTGSSWDLSIDGYTAPDGEKYVDVLTNQVSSHYFATMQIPLLHGREFTDRDTAKSPSVAIVNEAFARKYVSDSAGLDKALGKIIRLRDGGPIQIVGVAKNSNYGGDVGTPAVSVFYLPYSQDGSSRAILHVRTETDPFTLIPEVRGAISTLDPEVAPISFLAMSDVVSKQGLLSQRIIALFGEAFGLIALTLAVVGLYGVVSFMVSRRTQEIGIRMSLGAQRSTVLRMVLANGISLAAIGLLAGLVAAFCITPLVRKVLVGVSPRDPVTFFGIALVLFLATLIASWVPAHRATHVDPMVALRYE
jgi:predicted permease